MSNTKNKKILFITHETSRTGAPIILLNFLKWLKQNSNYYFEILAITGGSILSEFSELAPTTLLTTKTKNRLIIRAITEFNKHYPLLLKIFLRIKYRNFDLVYSNTMANGMLYPLLKHLNCPIITHVHELQNAIECQGDDNLEKIFSNTSQFVAVSQIVKYNLENNYGVISNKIKVIYEFTPTSSYSEIKKELNKSKNLPSFTVGASGTVSLRKGTDIFLYIAKKIIKENPKIPRFNNEMQRLI